MIGEGAMIPARIEAGEREMILRILGDAPAGSIFRRVNTSHEEVALAEASARKDEADLDTSVLSSDVLSMVCIEEPPELGALLLTQLGADRGVAVLSDMGEERGVEILSALSSMDPIQAHPSAFRSLAEVIKRYAPERAKGLRETEGGFDSAEFCVELLNGLEEGRRESLLSRLRDLDSEAAEHILAQLFRFEDIIRLSDRDIQKVLREIDSEELAKALLGVSEEVSEAFLRNMSSRAGKLLREEMDYVGSLPEERSEQSRRKVLELIRILDKQGDIVVPKNTAT
jgi:flagellar motor switch protein FliG